MAHVKICGITNLEDGRAAAEAGADLIGFIFYPPSPRWVTAERARAIRAALRAQGFAAQTVGVFVNEPLAHIREVIKAAELDFVQLHGQEAPDMVHELENSYQTLQPRDLDTAWRLMAHYRSGLRHSNGSPRLPALLVDSPPAQLPGGNGNVGDWSVARAVAAEFPILLAGGLTCQNVSSAIASVQPWGVDVSSGVERAPGIKDHARVREFIMRAKQGTPELARE